MRCYKLTNQSWKTYNETKWGPNVCHETFGVGELCSPGWLHAYEHPLLALLLNPIHADITNPVVWIAEAEGEFLYDGKLKFGCTKLITVRIIQNIPITLQQKVAFAIYCAKEVYSGKCWNSWADNWLNKNNQSADAADAAAAAATNAAAYAANAAADAAAANAAANAADAAYAADIDLIKLAKRAMLYK